MLKKKFAANCSSAVLATRRFFTGGFLLEDFLLKVLSGGNLI